MLILVPLSCTKGAGSNLNDVLRKPRAQDQLLHARRCRPQAYRQRLDDAAHLTSLCWLDSTKQLSERQWWV